MSTPNSLFRTQAHQARHSEPPQEAATRVDGWRSSLGLLYAEPRDKPRTKGFARTASNTSFPRSNLPTRSRTVFRRANETPTCVSAQPRACCSVAVIPRLILTRTRLPLGRPVAARRACGRTGTTVSISGLMQMAHHRAGQSQKPESSRCRQRASDRVQFSRTNRQCQSFPDPTPNEPGLIAPHLFATHSKTTGGECEVTSTACSNRKTGFEEPATYAAGLPNCSRRKASRNSLMSPSNTLAGLFDRHIVRWSLTRCVGFSS